MIPVKADQVVYEKFEIFGKKAIFSNYRIERSTIPEGLYAYDCRDCCDGEINQIQKHVMVNHWGTIILKEELPLVNGELPVTLDDYSYSGEICSLQDFIEDK